MANINYFKLELKKTIKRISAIDLLYGSDNPELKKLTFRQMAVGRLMWLIYYQHPFESVECAGSSGWQNVNRKSRVSRAE
jgi:hypothetical protein